MLTELKQQVCDAIQRESGRLFNIADFIFNNPELSLQEFKAAESLMKELKEAGFSITASLANLPTSIRATHPKISTGPKVAIMGEYDALPGIGHACGHHLIAAGALGACLGVAAVKDRVPGTLIFIGTPAEEEVGGKLLLVNAGVFDDIDAAMLFHPSSYTVVDRNSLACTEVAISFTGKAAHASSVPERGINALDAVIHTFVGINALRQHLTPNQRVHGIITNGGERPNIIPEYAAASFYVRALDMDAHNDMLEKLRQCAKAGEMATGAELKFEILETYEPMKVNEPFASAMAKNLETLGVRIEPPQGVGIGSTDVGNVSQRVPTVNLYLRVCEPGIGGHTREFREVVGSPVGKEAMLKAAKAMAMTAVDVLNDAELMKAMQADFKK